MKFFEPFRTQEPPSRTAVVFVPLESEPGLGLGQAPGGEPLSRRQLRHVARRCASVPNWKMWFEPRLLCAASDSATDGSTHDDLLDDRLVVHVGEARAAVLLGKEDAEEAELAELAEDLARELLGLVPAHDVGPDLGVAEIAKRLEDRLRARRERRCSRATFYR